MTSTDTSKDPTLICFTCKRFEATKNCDACNSWFCISCSQVSLCEIVRNKIVSGRLVAEHDFSYVRIRRCGVCYERNHLPEITQSLRTTVHVPPRTTTIKK